MGERPVDILVWVRRPAGPSRPAPVEEVRTRLGIPPESVYRVWPAGFGARLTAGQAAALRQDADVAEVQPDEPGRPAPYRQTKSAARVVGSHFVILRPGSDPAATAARLGVTPTGLYRLGFLGFAATMTDHQLDTVRRSPDVIWIFDDVRTGP